MSFLYGHEGATIDDVPESVLPAQPAKKQQPAPNQQQPSEGMQAEGRNPNTLNQSVMKQVVGAQRQQGSSYVERVPWDAEEEVYRSPPLQMPRQRPGDVQAVRPSSRNRRPYDVGAPIHPSTRRMEEPAPIPTMFHTQAEPPLAIPSQQQHYSRRYSGEDGGMPPWMRDDPPASQSTIGYQDRPPKRESSPPNRLDVQALAMQHAQEHRYEMQPEFSPSPEKQVKPNRPPRISPAGFLEDSRLSPPPHPAQASPSKTTGTRLSTPSDNLDGTGTSVSMSNDIGSLLQWTETLGMRDSWGKLPPSRGGPTNN